MGAADLWRLSNAPRPIELHTTRVGLGVLTGGYAFVVASRVAATDPLPVLVIRATILVALIASFVAFSRLSWRGLRLHGALTALIFPLGTAFCHGMLGNGVAMLPITAVAILMAMLFVQTGVDLLVVMAVQMIAQALLLLVFPPAAIPLWTAFLVVEISTIGGATLTFAFLGYRVALHASLMSLERALSAKSEFLNTMSHELRSPLHVIIGYTDMLSERAPAADASQLTRIRASALELLHLVENTMQVGRLGAGKLALQVERFAPAEVVHEVSENVQALPEAKASVPVRWEVSPDVPAVRLDRLKLKEIIQNLVSNALKFTRTGSVSVDVTRDGDRLCIAVRDTGPGIPADSQARVFEMFVRVEEPEVPRAGGAGLGLYIVKSLVELMDGDIEVASEVGVGTCFTVRLPLELPAAA